MHVVTVGKDGKLAFCPESIAAASGDLVQFQFYPKVFILSKQCTDLLESFRCPRFLRQRMYAHFRGTCCHCSARVLLRIHASQQCIDYGNDPYFHDHSQRHRSILVVLLSRKALSSWHDLRYQPHRREDSRRLQGKLCQRNSQPYPRSIPTCRCFESRCPSSSRFRHHNS